MAVYVKDTSPVKKELVQ